jgi:hypothetical protein
MEKGEVADFIKSYFFTSAKKKKKITFDTHFMDPQRIEILAKVLTVLMLYPDVPPISDRGYQIIQTLESGIYGFYRALDKLAEFRQFEN